VLGSERILACLLANQGVVADVLLSGQLDDVEREVALVPEPAPLGERACHDVAVEQEALRAAVIDSPWYQMAPRNGVGDDGVDHGVVEHGGLVLVVRRITHRAGAAGAGVDGQRRGRRVGIAGRVWMRLEVGFGGVELVEHGFQAAGRRQAASRGNPRSAVLAQSREARYVDWLA